MLALIVIPSGVEGYIIDLRSELYHSIHLDSARCDRTDWLMKSNSVNAQKYFQGN